GGLLQVGRGLLVEGGDADVADIVAFGVVLDRIDVDDVARDLDVKRIVDALAHYGERDRRVDRPAHLLDRFLKRKTLDLLLVERGDEIAALDAGLGRRRILDRGNDLDHAVLHRHLDAEPAELAARLYLHV